MMYSDERQGHTIRRHETSTMCCHMCPMAQDTPPTTYSSGGVYSGAKFSTCSRTRLIPPALPPPPYTRRGFRQQPLALLLLPATASPPCSAEAHLQVQRQHGVVGWECIRDRLHPRRPEAVLSKVQLRQGLVLPERASQLDSAAGSDLHIHQSNPSSRFAVISHRPSDVETETEKIYGQSDTSMKEA